jgi:methionyl aminopeptidase
MSIESPADLAALKHIGQIVGEILQVLRAAVRPGITTGELDALAGEELRKRAAESSPKLVYQFPGEMCISVNDEVVHGVPGSRRLDEGDIVKLDLTAQKNGYVADACISVAVGEVSGRAQKLMASAERAFRQALAVARAGNAVNEIGRAVEQEVRRSGFNVVRALTGHGVGRTIHEKPEVANYYEPRNRSQLTDGLVLTIEPIITAGRDDIYTASDQWTVKTRDRALSAHFEHTLVITNGDPIILTAA